MTTNKAIAGGLAGPVTVLIMYFLTQIPTVAAMPENVQATLSTVVSAVLGYVIVYLAPANAPPKN